MKPFVLCIVALLPVAFAQQSPMFAFTGGPSFLSGVFRQASNDVALIQMRNQAGMITQRLSNTTMITNIVRFNSFQCVDSTTYYAHYTGVSYPSNTTVNICNLVRYLNATTILTANTDLNVNSTCPGLDELPTLDNAFNTTASGQVTSRSVYTMVPTALNIQPPMCANVSSTITFKYPLVPSALPEPLANASCGPYSTAGGSPVGLGTWSLLTPPGSNTAYVGIETMNNTGGVIALSQDPTEITAATGSYLTSQCLGDASSKAVSFVVSRSLSGVTTDTYSCSTKSVVGQMLQATNALNITIPGAFIAPIPGMASGTCVNPPPVPRPSPSPAPVPSPKTPSGKACIYRGLWKIRPKYSNCQNSYLSYNADACLKSSKCGVTLVEPAQISEQKLQNNFGLNINGVAMDVSATSEDNIVVFGVGDSSNLAAKSIPGGSLTALTLQSIDYKWKVVPVSPNSCSAVNLVYTGGPSPKYLTLAINNGECRVDVMSWTDKNNGYAQWIMEKASELG